MAFVQDCVITVVELKHGFCSRLCYNCSRTKSSKHGNCLMYCLKCIAGFELIIFKIHFINIVYTTVRPLLSAVLWCTKYWSQKPQINKVCG